MHSSDEPITVEPSNKDIVDNLGLLSPSSSSSSIKVTNNPDELNVNEAIIRPPSLSSSSSSSRLSHVSKSDNLEVLPPPLQVVSSSPDNDTRNTVSESITVNVITDSFTTNVISDIDGNNHRDNIDPGNSSDSSDDSDEENNGSEALQDTSPGVQVSSTVTVTDPVTVTKPVNTTIASSPINDEGIYIIEFTTIYNYY